MEQQSNRNKHLFSLLSLPTLMVLIVFLIYKNHGSENDLAESQRKIITLEQNIEKLEKEVSYIRNQIDSLLTENEILQKEVFNLQRENDSLNEKVLARDAQIRALRFQLSKSIHPSTTAQLQGELDRYRQAYNEELNKQRRKEVKLQILQLELDGEKEKAQMLRKKENEKAQVLRLVKNITVKITDFKIFNQHGDLITKRLKKRKNYWTKIFLSLEVSIKGDSKDLAGKIIGLEVFKMTIGNDGMSKKKSIPHYPSTSSGPSERLELELPSTAKKTYKVNMEFINPQGNYEKLYYANLVLVHMEDSLDLVSNIQLILDGFIVSSKKVMKKY